jgi:hypothetical protein
VHRIAVTDVKLVKGFVEDNKDTDTMRNETRTKIEELRKLEAERVALKKENPELADDIDRMMDADRARILERK